MELILACNIKDCPIFLPIWVTSQPEKVTTSQQYTTELDHLMWKWYDVTTQMVDIIQLYVDSIFFLRWFRFRLQLFNEPKEIR